MQDGWGDLFFPFLQSKKSKVEQVHLNTKQDRCKYLFSFLIMSRQPKQDCKVDKLHLNKMQDRWDLCLWNAPTINTIIQGRTTTSQHKCKTDGDTFFVCNAQATKTRTQGRTTTSQYKCKSDRCYFLTCPNIQNTHAMTNNYTPLQMQDRFIFFSKMQQQSEKKCKGEQLHLNTNARPIERYIFEMPH